jgi:hypothetical protein
MSFKGSTTIAEKFALGQAGSQGVTQSTGKKLYYHGNLIAEWKKDGLYISNGGYVTHSRNGTEIPGSKTTKDKLNALPGVRLHQAKCKWILNCQEWNGGWIKIEGVTPPTEFDTKKAGNLYLMTSTYCKTDGWRGYNEPEFACVGANDTGMYSDSPCPTNIMEAELEAIKNMLLQNGVPTKQTVCQTSNIFCVHVYLVPQLKNVDKARQLVKQYLAENETRLAYVVEGAKQKKAA